jgi:hypothetical protein
MQPPHLAKSGTGCGKFVNLHFLYPLGVFSENVDDHIDNPNPA